MLCTSVRLTNASRPVRNEMNREQMEHALSVAKAGPKGQLKVWANNERAIDEDNHIWHHFGDEWCLAYLNPSAARTGTED